MDYDSLRKQVLAGKPLAFIVDGEPRPDPVQAARDEFAAEEWRRLVEVEKQRIRQRRSRWNFIKSWLLGRVSISITWRSK